MSAFDQLHPAIQHHIVNSLGWSSLRPVQEQCIEPVLAGRNVLLLAPTAGGKTEAAVFPLLSRMLASDWRGLSVIYVCPIRALLNNLQARLERYCTLVGRRCALWHGDVGDSERRRILDELPDVLLTTPESLEVMLILRQKKHPRLFANVQAVVVDELHAFAGDDRGWHLISVLERIGHLAQRRLQRIGLSATIGNPGELLAWLGGAAPGAGQVVAPGVEAGGGALKPDVTLDFVGSLENAATVIARLHAGQKRLVFCDSRARVEELAHILKDLGVETFVSHSSLSVAERRRAEEAFASRTNCVIAATSTLELGIDVGDLDRVIQIDAPSTVSSLLQRMGRTGRRPGSTRNCLFLATNREALLRAAGLIRLWAEGYVEPATPPAMPRHIFAQQVMALALQEGGIGRSSWRDWIGGVPGFAPGATGDADAIIDYMLREQILSQDGGILWLGQKGEDDYGRRHFMELFSSFTSAPLFAVKYGRDDIGLVDQVSFVVRREEKPVLLLGGRCWQVTHIDWDARTAFVEPTALKGRSSWLGGGPGMSYRLCQAIRAVLATNDVGLWWSKRACVEMTEARKEFTWLDQVSTCVVQSGDSTPVWWTFGGLRANAALADALSASLSQNVQCDNLSLMLPAGTPVGVFSQAVGQLAGTPDTVVPTASITRAIDDLKFSQCLPSGLAAKILQARLGDPAAVRAVLAELLREVVVA